MSRADLARRQAELVESLVAGGPTPDGFDPARVRATADALLRKRAGEVAAQWPALRAQFGPQWTSAFSEWARDRAPRGSLRDGWDYARRVALDPHAALELALREARYHYDGVRPPRLRRLPVLRRTTGALVVQLAGRTRAYSPRLLAHR